MSRLSPPHSYVTVLPIFEQMLCSNAVISNRDKGLSFGQNSFLNGEMH